MYFPFTYNPEIGTEASVGEPDSHLTGFLWDWRHSVFFIHWKGLENYVSISIGVRIWPSFIRFFYKVLRMFVKTNTCLFPHSACFLEIYLFSMSGRANTRFLLLLGSIWRYSVKQKKRIRNFQTGDLCLEPKDSKFNIMFTQSQTKKTYLQR